MGKRISDKLREQDTPTVLGYELDRETLTPKRQTIAHVQGADYGADPLGEDRYRMIPSGDVVDLAEHNRRLSK